MHYTWWLNDVSLGHRIPVKGDLGLPNTYASATQARPEPGMCRYLQKWCVGQKASGMSIRKSFGGVLSLFPSRQYRIARTSAEQDHEVNGMQLLIAKNFAWFKHDDKIWLEVFAIPLTYGCAFIRNRNNNSSIRLVVLKNSEITWGFSKAGNLSELASFCIGSNNWGRRVHTLKVDKIDNDAEKGYRYWSSG